MPSRNEPCPCGSAAKYKRCCLPRVDRVAAELRDRDALLGKVTDWVRDEHEQVLEDASGVTMLIRLMRGSVGRNMSMVWTLNDFTPADGGPPLMSRFAARPELTPSEREIVRGLCEARLQVHRVRAVMAGVGIELESLDGGARFQVFADADLRGLEVGDFLVARIVHATSSPTLWGLAARFEDAGERRWLARLATLPEDREQAALILLGFHPDDAAEPLPDGLELLSSTWPIDDHDAVLEALEDELSFECIGQATPTGWAFSWIEDSACGCPDLGGWDEDDGIETARIVVREREMTLVSGDHETLRTVASEVQQSLSDLIAPPRLGRAA